MIQCCSWAFSGAMLVGYLFIMANSEESLWTIIAFHKHLLPTLLLSISFTTVQLAQVLPHRSAVCWHYTKVSKLSFCAWVSDTISLCSGLVVLSPSHTLVLISALCITTGLIITWSAMTLNDRAAHAKLPVLCSGLLWVPTKDFKVYKSLNRVAVLPVLLPDLILHQIFTSEYQKDYQRLWTRNLASHTIAI